MSRILPLLDSISVSMNAIEFIYGLNGICARSVNDHLPKLSLILKSPQDTKQSDYWKMRFVLLISNYLS